MRLIFKYLSCFFSFLMPLISPAQSKSDSLESVFRKTSDGEEKAKVAVELIYEIYKSKGNSKSVDYYFSFSRDYCTREKNFALLSKAYNQKGVVFYYQWNIDSARHFFNTARDLARKYNNREVECKALNNLASIYYSQGKYHQSLNYYTEGVQKEAQYGFEEGTYISLNNIGYVYNAIKIREKAKEFFRKGLRYAVRNNDKNSMVFSFDGLSTVFSEIKMHDSALHYQLLTYKLSEELGDENGKLFSAVNLAGMYNEVGDKDNALKYLDQSRRMMNQFGTPDLMISSYGAYAAVYKNDPALASAYLDSALRLLNDGTTLHMKKDLFRLKAEIEQRKQNPDSAYHYLKKYSVLKDSIYNVELNMSLAELQTRFDVSQKEKQIEVLHERDKKKQLIIYFALVTGLIFLIIAVYIYKINRQRKKANELLEIRNTEISGQKHLIEEKNKEILDSIHYAKRIQTALLANRTFIDEHGPENFIYFNPKDIVSGDFYWASFHNNKFYLAVCDSTGHGVPGAFMSLLNIGFLAEAVKEKNITLPNKIFDYVRERLISTISHENQKDGMDGILLCIDKTNGAVQYSSANNAPVLIRENKIIELSKDKMPVGKGEVNKDFTLFTIDVQKGDDLYLYTDGYADQFGGEKGKKFKYKPLNELLLSLNGSGMNERKNILENQFQNWKGSLEQVDDVCVIGLKF